MGIETQKSKKPVSNRSTLFRRSNVTFVYLFFYLKIQKKASNSRTFTSLLYRHSTPQNKSHKVSSTTTDETVFDGKKCTRKNFYKIINFFNKKNNKIKQTNLFELASSSFTFSNLAGILLALNTHF